MSFKLFAAGNDGSYKIADVSNVPIWLTDTALECRRTSVTYLELAHEALSMLEEAVKMAELRPLKLKTSASKS